MMAWEFSLFLNVNDPEALKEAAMAHEDAQSMDPDEFIDDDGNVDISVCLRVLLDPGSIPGCSVLDSTAEGQ